MIKGSLQDKNNTKTKEKSVNIQSNQNDNLFQKFTVKDVVFLAIMSAVLIITCSVMPLVSNLTKILFGIAQLVTGLQMSLFCTIGLMKIRKPFSLTLMLIFMGTIMYMMSPIMGISNLFVAIFTELLSLLIFRGYKKDIACFVTGALVAPLSLVVPTIFNFVTTPEVAKATTSNGWVVLGMTLAVVAVGCLGAFIGMLISKELAKAGVIKKGK